MPRSAIRWPCAEAGITAATKAPSGGRIDHGLFTDAARDLVERRIPAPTRADLDRALAAAQQMMLSNGLTAAPTWGTDDASWNAMRRMGNAGGSRCA